MSGNTNQYDPAEMFREWIQRSGRAQAEFMRNFGLLMADQPSQKFDPVSTLNEVASKASKTQSDFLDNMTSIQNKSMDTMFKVGQMLPNFLNWGAYKTSVGSNGRISIPEAERNALGIQEGDLVQVVILPIAKKSVSKEVKN